MVNDLGKEIYPTYDEIWLYESKSRTYDWLTAHRIPCPRTWVFYDCREAMAFVDRAALPVVYKSDLGSAASGVRIFRDRVSLRDFVKECFERGFVCTGGDPRDRQWGRVLFQEYLPNVLEWRMIRLGDSYFGHQKLKEGEFHSGSCKAQWATPPESLLNFVRQVTECGRFTSMALDTFETEDGRWLINELQTVFGAYDPSQMYVNGVPGRYLYDAEKDVWVFQEGYFCRNACFDLRVETFAKRLCPDLSIAPVDLLTAECGNLTTHLEHQR